MDPDRPVKRPAVPYIAEEPITLVETSNIGGRLMIIEHEWELGFSSFTQKK
jgi:hypothetical protein